MLGGFDAAGKGATAIKKYKVAPGMDKVQIDFDLYAIDSWDAEKFVVSGNGVAKEVY